MNGFASYPSLHGRVAFVTGGGSGIGASIVEHLCAQRARVAFVDIDRAALGALVETIKARGQPAPLVHPVRPARHRRAARGGRRDRHAGSGRSACWSTTPPTTSATRSRA